MLVFVETAHPVGLRRVFALAYHHRCRTWHREIATATWRSLGLALFGYQALDVSLHEPAPNAVHDFF